eukprot:TRINITY_DN12503_c0_g1_i1.p1 TRINITY_DN12503_c0_g1~~TRINITY_DN12503_c0_g1_i1.p1  ORF type:complete len:546 (-),score=115.34 TRINITY_DN12503_c0_g1_i1:63-1700(-)
MKNILQRERTLSTVLFAKEVVFSLIIACLVVTIYILLYIGAVWNPIKYTERNDVIIANDDRGFDMKKILHTADDYIDKLDAVSHSLAKKLKRKVHKLADREIPSLGGLLANGLTTSQQTKHEFDWEVIDHKDAEDGKSLYRTLIDRIDRGDAWVGLYIPKNYSMAIFKAIQTPKLAAKAKMAEQLIEKVKMAIESSGKNSSEGITFDSIASLLAQQGDKSSSSSSSSSSGPSALKLMVQPFANPVTYVYDQGRQSAAHNIISGVMKVIFAQVSSVVSVWLIASPLGPFFAVALNPYFLSDPVQLQFNNLHPVPVNGMNMATYISPVVLWFVCLVTINLMVKDSARTDTKLATSGLVKWYHLVRWKVVVGIIFTCIEAQVLTFVLWCLGTEFVGNYAIYWLAQWYIAITFLFMQGALVGMFGRDLWSLPATLLLIVMLTAGGAFMSEELSNRFFYVGRGLPFYHTVRLNRTIIFGSFHRVHDDLLVLMAYALGSLLLSYVFLGYFQINKRLRAIAESSQSETIFAAAGALQNATAATPSGNVMASS